MSQFSIPQLQPVASPTQQFVAPRIQLPNGNSANQLAQLSNALAQVDNTLAPIANRRFEAMTEGAQARANEEFQKSRIDNTKALKDAVDKGQIAESDNPWFMVQLRQDVAANEASEKVRQMQVDWESSPVRFSDDPTQVENWAKGQINQTVQGKDAYESEAMAPIVQQGVNSIVGYHMDVRREERQQERLENLQDRLASVLMSPDQSQAPQQVHQIISDASHTMPMTTIYGLLVKSALASAEATGSDAVFNTLASVPDPATGKSMADMPEVQELRAKLPLMRLRRDTEYAETLDRNQKLQEEQNKAAVLSKLMTASGNQPQNVLITPEIAAKTGMSFKDVIDINTKAAEYGDSINGRAAKLTQQQAQGIAGQLESDLAGGKIKLTDPQVMDTLSRVAALAPESASQLNRFLYDYYEMQGRNSKVFAQQSDPQTYADLWSQAKAGTLTTETLIPQASKLAHDDWTKLFHETTKAGSVTHVSDFPMPKYDELLKDMIVYPAATKDNDGTPSSEPLSALGYQEALKDPEVQGRVMRAQTRLAETVQSFLNDPEFSKLPRDEQSTRIRKALDATAQEFGGITDEQRQKVSQQQADTAAKAKMDTAALLRPESTTVNGVTEVSTGVSVGAPTLLTDAQRGVIRDVSKKLSDSPHSLENIYANPFPDGPLSLIRSDWYGERSVVSNLSPQVFKDRESAYLFAFVRNARLLGGGTYQANSAVDVADPKYEGGTPHLRYSASPDVEQSAKILFSSQRRELANMRLDMERQWITPDNQSKLLSLTTDISALQASGKEVPREMANQFQELSDKFRLHDFLGVTAGVSSDQVAKDWKLLKQYPAASDFEGLKQLIPLIHSIVPEAERQGVFEAQRLLITRAQRLLKNGQYTP